MRSSSIDVDAFRYKSCRDALIIVTPGVVGERGGGEANVTVLRHVVRIDSVR